MKCLKMHRGPVSILVPEDDVTTVEEKLEDGFVVKKNKYGEPIFVDSRDIKSASNERSLNELLKDL